MTFVSPETCIEKLRNLRNNYKDKTGVDLSTAKQPNTLLLWAGSKDVKTRNKDIEYIDKWLDLFERQLDKATATHNDYIEALRIMTIVSLSRIKDIANECTIPATARSETKKLIHDAVHGEQGNNNYLDDETRAACYYTAQRFLYENKFNQINEQLKNKFTDKEWSKFIGFVNNQCDIYQGKNIKNNFPITRIMMPLCATPLRIIGTSAGWVFGDITSRTTTMLPMQGKLAVAIGYGMYMMMGSTAGTGVLILTPTYAAKLIESVSGFTLSWLCGVIMGATGNLIGWTLGMSLDLSWQLIVKGFQTLSNIGYDSNKLAKVSGHLLTDGSQAINGVVIKAMCSESIKEHIPEGSVYVPYCITDQELTIHYDNTVTTIPFNKIGEQPHIKELMQYIASGKTLRPTGLPENDETPSVMQLEDNEIFSELH